MILSRIFQGPKGLFVIIDYIVSLLAIPANCIVLESLANSHFSLTGYRGFLISLAVSDLYMCVVNLLTFMYQSLISYSSNNVQLEKCGADVLRSLMFVGFFANLFNLCGMSIDHLIGILYPLRYRYLINKRVARIAVITIWVVSLVLGFADFPIITLIYLQRQYHTQGPNGNFTFMDVASRSSPGDNATWNSTNSANIQVVQQAILKLLGVKNSQNDYDSDEEAADSEPDYTESVKEVSYAGTDVFNDTAVIEFDENEEIALSHPILDEDFSCILPTDIDALLKSLIAENGTNVSFGDEATILKAVKCNNEHLDWCSFYLVNNYWQELGVISLTLIGAVFLSICYGRIFKEIFSHLDSPKRSLRKLVMTTFLLLGTFTICWLPFMTFEFGMLMILQSNIDISKSKTFMNSTSLFVIHNCLNTVLICYPLADPIIYSSRVPLVKRYILCRYCRFFPGVREYLERSTLKQSVISSKASLGRHVYLKEVSTSYLQPPGHLRANSSSNSTNCTASMQATSSGSDLPPTPAPTSLPDTPFVVRYKTSPRQSAQHHDDEAVFIEVVDPQNDNHQEIHIETYEELVAMNSEILPLSLYPPGGKRSGSNSALNKAKRHRKASMPTAAFYRRSDPPAGKRSSLCRVIDSGMTAAAVTSSPNLRALLSDGRRRRSSNIKEVRKAESITEEPE